MSVISNKLGQSTVLHFSSNATITITGNSSVSNIAMGSEIVSNASIRRIWYGGPATIMRGSNVVASSTQSGEHDFAGHGCAINLFTDAPLVINMSGTNFVMIELSKKSNQTSGSGTAGTG